MSSVHSEIDRDSTSRHVSVWNRVCVAVVLVVNLRKPDFQAAGTFVKMRFSGWPFPLNWFYFIGWALYQMFVVIPDVMQDLSPDGHVSNTPMWLLDENPLANYPWNRDSNTSLPMEVDTLVIGAGFTGGAIAYHWSKKAPQDRRLVVIEMGDPASGSSGRNEGLVVMGRYFKMVRDTVLKNLDRVRPQMTKAERCQLAEQFAHQYCRSAYRNADLIEQTIRNENFDCDYARAGWVQGRTATEQNALSESVQMAIESGYDDWKSIVPDEVLEKTGMQVEHNAGFSVAAASWHPAKWVWCLLKSALTSKNVELFTRTRVRSVTDKGDFYLVDSERGAIRAHHVVYATESYTPKLERRFHDAILPMQEQAASGDGGPEAMKPHIGISGPWFFAGRYGQRVLFGSGGSRVCDEEAGRNRPSQFLTKFVAAQLKRCYGPFQLHMTNEWSGTVGYTPDEFPIVGVVDDKQKYIIAGMCGSGSGVSFNAGRCVVDRILEATDEEDDYPPEYFSPMRLLDPANHKWPDTWTAVRE